MPSSFGAIGFSLQHDLRTALAADCRSASRAQINADRKCIIQICVHLRCAASAFISG
jgi:hypothetical protein